MLKSSRALLLGIFIGVLVMSLLPVSALDNNPSGEDRVAPTVIPHFGGDDCADPNVASLATHSYTVVTPANGTYTDSSTGAKFKLSNVTSRSTFTWSIVATATDWVVYDVVVKGGTTSNHFDYQESDAGLQTGDTLLHAPVKGNRFDNLSHISFCYDVRPLTISGTKFHDRDSDGVLDTDTEEPLGGWTISAYNTVTGNVVTGVTGSDGKYKLEVGSGSFIVCESVKAELNNFSWQQTSPTGTACSTLTPPDSQPLAPGGHEVAVGTTHVTGKDFLNVRGVTIGCGDQASINETGMPGATVSVPSAGCTSADRFMVFDVGVNPDENTGEVEISQFVVFGGDPTGTVVFSQTINWLPEDADYDEFGNLTVPPTLVVLQPGGFPVDPVPGPVCVSGQPNADVPDCRFSRVITEDGSSGAGEAGVPDIKVTEVWKFLGDPTRGR